MKGQKGITLVALVITIIVMLILVGVTITVAMQGGLFDQARNASTDTQVAQIKEAMGFAKADVIAEFYDSSKTTGKSAPSAEELKEKIDSYLDDKKIVIEVGSAATSGTETVAYTVSCDEPDTLDFSETLSFDLNWKK